MTFQLDTSGHVALIASDGDLKAVIWLDLDPFTQGYVEALFAGPAQWTGGRGFTRLGEWAGFRNLAPETLVQIMEDCADAQRGISHREMIGAVSDNERRSRGRGHWDRQRHFLTVALNDAGRVVFA